MHVHIFSPSHLGFACERHRVYALLLRKDSLCLAVPWGNAALFKNLFYRTPKLPGSVHLRAPPGLVEDHIRLMAQARRMPPQQCDGSPWRFQHVCSSGKRKCINAYLEKAREKVNTNGGTNDDLDDTDFIIEPEQYPTFGGITVRAPALTRSAQPYSFKRKRVILAEEKLEVMGLPVFAPNNFPVHTPFKDLLFTPELSDAHVHGMMGNAMHVAAESSMPMVGLGCTKRAAPSAVDLG